MGGGGLKLCRIIHNISRFKNTVFYCRCLSTLVAMATLNFHRLIIGKLQIDVYCYFIADIWQKIFRNVCCVVLYQTYTFCPSISIWLVTTKRPNLWKKIFNQRTIGPVSLTWVLRICWIRTNLEIQEHSMLFKLSPIQKHQEQIWPYHKNGQGQPRVIIWKKRQGMGI